MQDTLIIVVLMAVLQEQPSLMRTRIKVSQSVGQAAVPSSQNRHRLPLLEHRPPVCSASEAVRLSCQIMLINSLSPCFCCKIHALIAFMLQQRLCIKHPTNKCTQGMMSNTVRSV